VKHLDRFRQSDSVRTLAPERLESLPDDRCAPKPAGEPQGKLAELATLGCSRWFWFSKDARVDGVPTSTGRLVEVSPDGRVTAVWGLTAEDR
jgi:hypothetical protein